ncbi:MAG: hypothetical protein R6W89_07430 [Candidatus Hydrogenedentota bacterium]
MMGDLEALTPLNSVARVIWAALANRETLFLSRTSSQVGLIADLTIKRPH